MKVIKILFRVITVIITEGTVASRQMPISLARASRRTPVLIVDEKEKRRYENERSSSRHDSPIVSMCMAATGIE